MVIRLKDRRRVAAVAFALLAASSAATVFAAQRQALPDLLDAPAAADLRAQISPQLSVAVAGERLVGVGVRGIVLLSDDGGRVWRQAKSVPVSVALTDVHFATPTEGWAVGHSGVILRTRDGGETWQLQMEGRRLAQLILDDVQARTAAGDASLGRALRDAQRFVEEGPDKPFLGVRFVDARRGFAVGAYGIALMTEDGGETWQSLMGRIPNPRGVHLYSIQQRDADVLIAGEQGALFRSEDGGQRFVELETPYPGTFFGVLIIDSDTLLAYGLRGNAWRSADRGANWEQIDLGQPVTVTSGKVLLDRSILLADESGRLMRSSDAGRSFKPVEGSFPTGLTGLAQGSDKAVVLSGVRGLTRVEPAQFVAESR